MDNNTINLNIKRASRWLDDHGYPNADELQKLGNTNSFSALEQLREWADAFNITYDMTHTQRELADRIAEAMSRGENAQAI